MEKIEAITLLAIDDKPDNLTTLRAVLRDALPQANVLTATNGPAGIDLAAAEDPDVILLDIVMPGMDGFEVCRRLKNDERIKDIPVLFVTAIRTDTASRVKALEVGAEGFLAKPLEPAELTAQIRAMAKVKAANRSQRIDMDHLEALVAERTRELRESEEKHRILLDESNDPIFSLTAAGSYRYVNRAFAAGVGKPVEEIIGRTMWDVFPKEEADKRFAALSQVFRTGEEKVIEVRVPRPNGDRFYLTSITPIKDEQGSVVIAICSSKDITERKQAEEALRQSEEQYRAIVAASPDCITITDLTGKILIISPKTLDKFGYEAEQEIVGKQVSDFLVPEDRARAMENIGLMFQGKFNGVGEYCGIRKDGSIIDIEANADFITDATGQPRRILFIVRDITERKQAEEALRESEERFKALYNASFGGIAIHDKGVILDCNKGLSEVTGYSLEELIGMDGLLLIAPQSREKVKGHILAGYEKPYEAMGIRKDGEEYYLRLEARNIPYKGKMVRTVEFRDITEHKAAGESLRESKQLLESIVENIPLMIFLKEAEQLRFVLFNQAGEELVGYPRKDLLGKNDLDFFPPEQAAWFMTKDREVLAAGAMLDIPEEPILTAGRGERLLHTRKVCIKGLNGTPKYLLGISEDITERKQAEEALRRLNAELEQRVAERTAELTARTAELERINKVFVGRELRMRELKERIAELEKKR